MLAMPLAHQSHPVDQQAIQSAEKAWIPADDMDCDDDQIRVAYPVPSGVAANVLLTMMPSSSSHSISSSTSSNDNEPELSRSLGSVSSFDLRTPLKPSQAANHSSEPSDSFDILGSTGKHISQSNVARGPSSISKSLLAEALAARKPRVVSLEDSSAPSSPVIGRLQLPSEHVSPKASSPSAAMSSPSPLNRANKPKLTLLALSTSAFSRPSFPQTPGGSQFFGARDGAATGAPVSPFLPPTPLVASMMEVEQAKGPSSSHGHTSSMEDVCLSPQMKRQSSLPFAVSTPRQNKAFRPSLQRHGSIGMSPLSSEFASVSVRGKTRSNEDSAIHGSPVARRSNEKALGLNPGSPSKLLTPPYSPLVLAKSLPEEASILSQRRSSSSSSSVSSSSSKKLRAKESLLGGGTDLSRSFSASRLKSSSRTKAAPKPFNLSKAFLGEPNASHSGPQPLSAPAMKISFAEEDKPRQTSPDALSPVLASTTMDDLPAKAQSDTPVKTMPDSSLLSPCAALKAPAMEKSFSAPLPPQTVSARHLADYELHPRFAASYTLGDELGSGGFGFVVAAKRNKDDLPVAVKFIFKDKVPAHGWVRDPVLGVIPMEAFVLKVVDHPGVVKFIDLFDDRSFFYLVMELHGTPWQPVNPEPVPEPPSKLLRPAPMQRRTSCDLFECIEQHSRLSEEQARWVFAQVVETVWHLDRIGICHRDIKDENCVVDSDFNVKLIDFGSAVITDIRKPQPYFNRFFGTMTFASPEILQGKPYRAPHAEIWSLGVLLSILLSGQCPFADPAAAIKGRISKPKGAWSTEALNLLLICLEVDPERRATISQIRDHPWVHQAWKDRAAKLNAA